MGFGKDGQGVIIRESRSQVLGTLANQTGLLIGTKIATVERFRMLKTEVTSSVIDATAGELGGLVFGLADGDLTLAEIEAAIEVTGPLGPNDITSTNVAMRPVWFMGGITVPPGTDGLFLNEEGGPTMESKPRWTFASIKSWNFFVYNMGAALTTGATVIIKSKSFGVWVT